MKNLKSQISNLKREGRLGFTIVELVVIIGIVGFMSAMVILGQNQGSDQRKVMTEARQLAQDLRKSQNFTISSTTHDCGGAIGTKVVPFGIILDENLPDRYRLVADCNENKVYDSAVDKILNTVILLETKINSVVPSNPLQIFFAPPNPDTYVNGVVSANATITLVGIKRSAMTRGVYVTGGGAISVQ